MNKKGRKHMTTEQDGGLIVLFGATGDLSKRMILPALYQLYQRGLVSKNFVLIGAAETEMTDEEFRELVKKAVEKGPNFEKLNEDFLNYCHYLPTHNTQAADLKALKEKIEALAQEYETPEEYLYYYAIAPQIYDETTQNIQQAKITDLPGNHRVIIEKPVGESLESAKEYDDLFLKVFDKESIYFMDHFPGLDFIQNILATRFFNPFIEGIWNKQFIENIQISLPENLSIGERGNYYDDAGVLLDMFQNHVLQILTLVAMELPEELTSEAIHEKKLDVLRSIATFSKDEVAEKVIRGQYQADSQGKFNSYRNEADVPEDSDTSTYIAVELSVDFPRWEGVPFYLRTGKALIEDYTAVDIIFKTPATMEADVAPRLTFMAEPGEGLSLVLNQKTINNQYEPLTTFIGPDEKMIDDQYIPQPYENMLHDALVGNRTYFPIFAEIKEQWRITDSILARWAGAPAPDFPNYRAGTFGPSEAEELLKKNGHVWIKRPDKTRK